MTKRWRAVGIVVLLGCGSATGETPAPTSDSGAPGTDTNTPGTDTAGGVDTKPACVCGAKVCGDDGCGGTCGTCGKGFQCNSGRCDLNPLGVWALSVVSGEVDPTNCAGAAWDTLGGAPDPRVCVALGTAAPVCTPTISDTFKPVWNFALPDTTANTLAAGVGASVDDEDVTDFEVICTKGTVAMPVDHFVTGTFTFGCACTTGGKKLATITMKLVPK